MKGSESERSTPDKRCPTGHVEIVNRGELLETGERDPLLTCRAVVVEYPDHAIVSHISQYPDFLSSDLGRAEELIHREQPTAQPTRAFTFSLSEKEYEIAHQKGYLEIPLEQDHVWGEQCAQAIEYVFPALPVQEKQYTWPSSLTVDFRGVRPNISVGPVASALGVTQLANIATEKPENLLRRALRRLGV